MNLENDEVIMIITRLYHNPDSGYWHRPDLIRDLVGASSESEIIDVLGL